MKYCYKKADAFTTAHSMGNPAACIYLKKEEKLTREAMQQIAKAHAGFVCEMAFCQEAADHEADYDVCYYSRQCEVDFCGHGTIACMYSLLKEMEEKKQVKELKIRTKKGILTVYNEVPKQDAVFIMAPEPQYQSCQIDEVELAEKLGISQAEIDHMHPIELINAGLSTLIVPIKHYETEISMLPDRAVLEDYVNKVGADIILVFCQETEDKHFFRHSRVFAPKFGYLEDPATGSGNSAFGYYLLKNGEWKGEPVSIEQGNIKGGFNEVCLMTKQIKGKVSVLFGGRGEIRIEGYYHWNE